MKWAILSAVSGGLAVILLAGCGNLEGNQENAANMTAASGTETSVLTEIVGEEDTAHIVVAYPTNGTIPKDLAKVQEAINEITLEMINTEVELFTVEIGSYAQQMNLKISSGEQVDCMLTFPVGSCNFQTLTSQNIFRPLSDLLESYGQDVTSIVGDKLMAATTYKDDIYGIPCYYDVAESVIWYMRKDILEKYDLTEEALAAENYEDIKKVLKKVHESDGEIAPIGQAVLGGQVITKMDSFYPGDFSESVFYDRMGDTTIRMAGVNISGDDKTVVNVYDSEDYKNTLETIHLWYEEGLVYKDASISQESPETLMKSGTIFSWITVGNPTQLASKESAAGYELVQKEIEPVILNSTSLRNFVWGITQTSQEPEAAMKFLNLMYSNADIVNLFNLGIEGEHYIDNGDGTVSFPTGVDQNDSGYYTFTYWMYGNAFLRKVWEGDDPEVLAEREKVVQNAETSPLLGFSFDSGAYDLEITAVTNVINEYRPGLESGSQDPETLLPEFIDALNKAGGDVLLKAYQEQLDAWWAEQES